MPLSAVIVAFAPPVHAENSKPSTAADQSPRHCRITMELSEYETVLSEDGSEWASDHGIPMHEGERKDRAWKVEAEDRARHTTEEAQLQRDLFAKIPRQLYAAPPRMQKVTETE